VTFTLVAHTRWPHHSSPAAAPAASFKPAIRTRSRFQDARIRFAASGRTPLVCGHEETTAAIEQVIISIQISSTDQPAARNKQETAAKIFTFMLQNVFHAIRTDASPA